MPKEVAIVEGQSTLMDPAGKEFQDMLSAARLAAVEKLTVKDDTSMVEKDVEKVETVSSTETKDKGDIEAEEKEVPEVPGDDIGNLKNQLSGVKAELARARKQKAGSAEEAQGLKERLADMEGQMKVLRENKTTLTLDDKLAKLTDKQVTSNRRMWEDELIDARVEARQAAKDGDSEAVKLANSRIADANSMLEKYDDLKESRAAERAKGRSTEDDEKAGIAADLDLLFKEVAESAPDIFKKDTPIWKAGQAEYSKLPKLMRQLGPMGELVAAAAAIAKHPELVGKKVADKAIDNLVGNIEKAADKAFNKGGTAPTTMQTVTTTINNQADAAAFEERVRKIKGG